MKGSLKAFAAPAAGYLFELAAGVPCPAEAALDAPGCPLSLPEVAPAVAAYMAAGGVLALSAALSSV